MPWIDTEGFEKKRSRSPSAPGVLARWLPLVPGAIWYGLGTRPGNSCAGSDVPVVVLAAAAMMPMLIVGVTARLGGAGWLRVCGWLAGTALWTAFVLFVVFWLLFIHYHCGD